MNSEHVKALKRGSKVWNQWRAKNPSIRPDLSGSNLSYSNLSGSDLRGSNLSGSDLSGSNLSGSDLSYSDLRGSNLSGSNLSNSNLRGSDLPSPTMMLLADWYVCSDSLTLALMRFDASNHPTPDAFLAWGKGGPCPYADTKIQRSADFTEKRSLIKANFLRLRVKSAFDLMQALIAEKCKQ